MKLNGGKIPASTFIILWGPDMSSTINGFGFIEYAAKDAAPLHQLFRQMGFTAIKKHKSQPITLYRQGQTDFYVNDCSTGFAAAFAAAHVPYAPGSSIVFADKHAPLAPSLTGVTVHNDAFIG